MLFVLAEGLDLIPSIHVTTLAVTAAPWAHVLKRTPNQHTKNKFIKGKFKKGIMDVKF